jgi:hypothetical protein
VYHGTEGKAPTVRDTREKKKENWNCGVLGELKRRKTKSSRCFSNLFLICFAR